MSLTITFLYINIFNQCVKSRNIIIISDEFVEKHIMVDARPIQEIPYQDIMRRFIKAQGARGFASQIRYIHSFLVTSNIATTIKGLKMEYKEAINRGKDHVNSMDIEPKPVAVIHMKIKREKGSTPYNITDCEFSNKATFKLGALSRMEGENTKYEINHFFEARLKNAEECQKDLQHPDETCPK